MQPSLEPGGIDMDNGTEARAVPSSGGSGRGRLAGLLVAVPLLAALFYGVVGEDKFLLLSPLVILGYGCLAGWLGMAALGGGAPAAAPPAFWLFVAFTAFGAWRGPVSTIPFEAELRMLTLGLFAGGYFLWANSLSLFRRARTVLGWVLLFAMLASFYGLVNHFKQPEMVLWAERFYDYEGRLASTYICPNHFAHLLQMLLPFCLVLPFIPQAGPFLRILAGYCFLVFLPAITLTESRAGMLGAIAALGTTVLLVSLRRSRKLFLLLLVAVPLAATLLLVGAWNYSEMFKRRMAPVVEFLADARKEGFANTDTTDFRPLTWLDTIDQIKERPLLGFGPGSYRYVFEEYRKRCGSVRVVTGHPHNEFLEVAAEYGLAGFALLALAWGWGLVRLLAFALKTPNLHHAFMAMAFLGTAAGTLLHSFFDFQMHVFQNAMVFSLLAAIAAGPLCGRKVDALARDPGKWRRGGMRLACGALAVAAAAGLLLAARSYGSSFFRAKADRLAEMRQGKRAEQGYRLALRIDPSNWRAYRGWAGLVAKDRYYALDREEMRALAAQERDLLAKGHAHNPKDAELTAQLGLATIFLGEVDEGLGLLNEAAALRPFNDVCWWILGVAQRKAGRYGEALEAFRYAGRLRNSPSIRKNIQWLEQQLAAGPAEAGPPRTVPGREPDLMLRPSAGPSLDDLHRLMESP